MEILNSESIELTKDKKNNLIPEIINRIYSICKTQSDFPHKKEIKEVEESLTLVHNKINKQDNLFEKSKEMRDELNRKINIINGENYILQEELLESLGSEM